MRRRLSVEAVVTDSAGQVLLVRQGRTRHDWELPGGKLQKSESLLACLAREIKEELTAKIATRYRECSHFEHRCC